MPRGGYDCTGAAPGSFASRQGRQMYPCGGGTTPRASSQAATFPPTMQYHHPAAAAAGRHPSQAYAAPQPVMSYGYPGAAPHAGFMPPQGQQQQGYMAGGFVPAQQPQVQALTPYGYAPASSAMQGVVYAGGAPAPGGYPQQPQQQHQQGSLYGAGSAPVGQAPYYRHP